MTTTDPDAERHAAELVQALHGYRAHTYRAYRAYRSRRAFLEDVEWLLDAGESPWEIAKRLGMDRRSVGKRLHRYGRDDLARGFYSRSETGSAS